MSHAAPLDNRLSPSAPVGAVGARRVSRAEDDRPPPCPTCNRRLVILTTHTMLDDRGNRQRYQLWGCPRGHSTARRIHGAFLPVEVLPDL